MSVSFRNEISCETYDARNIAANVRNASKKVKLKKNNENGIIERNKVIEWRSEKKKKNTQKYFPPFKVLLHFRSIKNLFFYHFFLTFSCHNLRKKKKDKM